MIINLFYLIYHFLLYIIRLNDKGCDMEMGSNKCTLRKEIKNEIAKYIDNEFMNETMKEIVNYIKTTSKVVIDDSNYDESDIDSRVELKDNGAFNIHDYMYVKDFLYELSWEGS